MRKDIDAASALDADEVDAAFNEAKKKAAEAVGRVVPEKRDLLPQGVRKRSPGKFRAYIRWGGMVRYIGTFDNPEQASAAYISVKKDLARADLSTLSADEFDAVFDEARKKAMETVGRVVPKKKNRAGLPRGVRNQKSGKFQAVIWCGNKDRHIGIFGTAEQASAAYMSVRKDLDNANISALGADEINTSFEAAKKNALESVGGFIRALPTGVRKTTSGKFESRIQLNGKGRQIGTFDTLEQASAAYMSARKNLDDGKEVDTVFDEARKSARESVERSGQQKKKFTGQTCTAALEAIKERMAMENGDEYQV